METLTRHPPADAAADPAAPLAVPAPEPAAPADGAPAEAEPACATCAAPMAAGQDWCLECGTAAPGRLGRRPGWRAVGSTLALTLLLVGGAGAASYAALSSDATRGAAAPPPADGTPVAQAPPAVPAPAAPAIPPTVVTPPAASKLPTPPRVSLPSAPVVPSSPVRIPSTPAKSATTTPKGSTTDSSVTGTRGTGTSSGDTAKPVAALTPLAFDAASVSLYDPYGRATPAGDPADAHDGDTATAFTVGSSSAGNLQVGVVVDLGAVKQVRGLTISATKGVAVEVYASDSSVLPPDILDTRWDHPASRKATSTTEKVTFPRGGKRYRYVTVWFTKAPKAVTSVAVKELELLH